MCNNISDVKMTIPWILLSRRARERGKVVFGSFVRSAVRVGTIQKAVGTYYYRTDIQICLRVYRETFLNRNLICSGVNFFMPVAECLRSGFGWWLWRERVHIVPTRQLAGFICVLQSLLCLSLYISTLHQPFRYGKLSKWHLKFLVRYSLVQVTMIYPCRIDETRMGALSRTLRVRNYSNLAKSSWLGIKVRLLHSFLSFVCSFNPSEQQSAQLHPRSLCVWDSIFVSICNDVLHICETIPKVNQFKEVEPAPTSKTGKNVPIVWYPARQARSVAYVFLNSYLDIIKIEFLMIRHCMHV